MIIDAHIHAFPYLGGASGYKDVATHMKVLQRQVSDSYGKIFITSHTDDKYKPLPDEDVNFRVGKYGKYCWTKHGEECWMQRLPIMVANMEWPPEHMLAYMDWVGVNKGVLQGGYMEKNAERKYIAELVKKWPNRLIGTFRIDYDINKNEEYREMELRKLKDGVKNLGMKGLYEVVPKGQKIDDEKFDPLWGEITSLDIPVWSTNLIRGARYPSEWKTDVSRMENVMKKFPDLNLIIGTSLVSTKRPKIFFNLLRLPTVTTEIGYVLAFENWNIWKENSEYPYPLHTKIVEAIYDEFGPEKMMWGSDMPFTFRTCTYRQCLDTVRLHCNFLSEEEKRLVIGGNAARVFKV